jgi:hypothetical protein
MIDLRWQNPPAPGQQTTNGRIINSYVLPMDFNPSRVPAIWSFVLWEIESLCP